MKNKTYIALLLALLLSIGGAAQAQVAIDNGTAAEISAETGFTNVPGSYEEEEDSDAAESLIESSAEGAATNIVQDGSKRAVDSNREGSAATGSAVDSAATAGLVVPEKQEVRLQKASLNIVEKSSGKTAPLPITKDDFTQYEGIKIKLLECWREPGKNVVDKYSAIIETIEGDWEAKRHVTEKHWIFSHNVELNTHRSSTYMLFLIDCGGTAQ